MHTGEQIKEIRLKLIMSQEDFAKELGTSQKVISMWESGKTKISLKKERILVKFLKCENS